MYILNISVVKNTKASLSNIISLREYYKNNQQLDEEISMNSAADIVERTTKATDAADAFEDYSKSTLNKKLVIYGKPDPDSVLNFYSSDKDGKININEMSDEQLDKFYIVLDMTIYGFAKEKQKTLQATNEKDNKKKSNQEQTSTNKNVDELENTNDFEEQRSQE